MMLHIYEHLYKFLIKSEVDLTAMCYSVRQITTLSPILMVYKLELCRTGTITCRTNEQEK
jgi:hypothetical protein